MSDLRTFTNHSDPRFTAWVKSTRSGSEGNCVYVSAADGLVAVADSKAGPHGPVQVFTREGWAAFVAGVRGGEFDI